MFLRIVRFWARVLIRLLLDVTVVGMHNLPPTGTPAVVASNHIGRLDAMLAMMLADREDIIMLIAEKYRKYLFWRWIGKRLDTIWLNRTETDFRALREVQKRLQRGEVLAVAPEGTRSPTGQMQQAKLGAAYLATKAHVPVIPTALSGSEDQVVLGMWRRGRRPKIRIEVGTPILLPPLARKDRDAFLRQQADEIMCHVGVMLPRRYHGFYQDHPRLLALLAEKEGK